MSTAEQFEKRKYFPVYWYNKASDLLGAAAAVWASMDRTRSDEIVRQLGLQPAYQMGAAVPPVFRMLCGLALELLFKATLIAQDKEIVETHNLSLLYKKIDLALDSKEEKLLELLAESVIWAGKYPIPKNQEELDKLNDLATEVLFTKTQVRDPRILTPNHALNWRGFKNIWDKAESHYWKQKRSRSG